MFNLLTVRLLDAPVEGALAPLDRLRAFGLSLLGRHLAPWVANRERRVALWGALLIGAAFAMTAVAPLWLLALGPIVLGVPHVVADLRYLWLRPGYHRRWLSWPCTVAPIVVAGITGEVAWGLGAALGALVAARGTWSRRLIALAVLAPLMAASIAHPGWARLVFAHAHNFLAVALWWCWRPRSGKHHLVPLVLFVAASAVIALGGCEAIAALCGVTEAPGEGLSMNRHLRTLAPFASGEWGVRLILLYAFAQSVHYGIWLRLVPEDDRSKSSPRPFIHSYRKLVRDVGRPLFVLALAAAVAVAVWAVYDLAQARSGYLRFAIFHGHLELAAAAWLWMERPRRRSEAT